MSSLLELFDFPEGSTEAWAVAQALEAIEADADPERPPHGICLDAAGYLYGQIEVVWEGERDADTPQANTKLNRHLDAVQRAAKALWATGKRLEPHAQPRRLLRGEF